MKNTLVKDIKDCIDMINELRAKRESLQYSGIEETNHKTYLQIKAIDGAIAAIESEKRQYENLLNDTDENLLDELLNN